jgi:hypothetical protein
MSTEALIAELEALPEAERSRVLAHFAQKDDDSWVPESFRKAMEQADAGKTYPMEDALSGNPPPEE